MKIVSQPKKVRGKKGHKANQPSETEQRFARKKGVSPKGNTPRILKREGVFKAITVRR